VSVPEFSALCEKAGFTVEEVHTRRAGRHRDHLAIVACKPKD